MRKLIAVGMLVGGLLGVAGPATAQLGDPLTVAASGVLLPFFGGGGNLSLLEVASPVGSNLGVHMLFFNANCGRQNESQGLPLTTNDVAHLNPALIVPNVSGLIALAQVDATGFNLVPLESGVHARVYWVTPNNRYRVLEPIIIDLDLGGVGNNGLKWNSLRTAATFFAPPDGVSATTTLFLICPRDTIQGGANDAFPTSRFWPISPIFTTGASTLRARIYDAKETFLRDKLTECDCLTTKRVTDISNIYALLPEAADGTYTEIEASPTATAASSFMGYRVLEGVGSTQDFFGRLSNGNRGQVQGGIFNPAVGSAAVGR